MSRVQKKNKTAEIGSSAEAILESISDGVFTVDQDWRIASFNRAAEIITGISRKAALGKVCSDVFRASMCEADCALRHTVKTGKPVIDKPAFIVNSAGNRIPISVSTAILRNESGAIIGGAETFRDLTLVAELRKELEGRFSIGDIVSRSSVLRRLFDLLPQIALSNATVLIHGETGTGKELLARAIHNHSPRKHKPFISLNCGALPDSLLESELFGYVRGAFTGANRDKPGRFALADGGTIFLDEIGDISPSLQVKLLRVIQEKTYEPLGGTSTRRSDVRIITATHRDLPVLVRKGLFREDLFYRLNVFKMELPPLRARNDDIPILIEHFIARFNRLQGKSVTGISAAALSLLVAHDYPGNVRELENIIERAFVFCETGKIERAHLPSDITGQHARPDAQPEGSIKTHTKAAEEQAIRTALKKHGFNRLAAARALAMHKTTLFRKIKSLRIDLPEQDGRSVAKA